ncbi:fungal transcriptional regulatory protein [Ophiostoma piceae UAMH 11346]|uniref:Fungal transcriptional regulatory protein n=1 Tax=Ophiostoma piceae (strain UAMH 11346) TaxID=1262450 RepID=S3BWQ4_OPHP1|nr:fungal transcriptional regulatory protein [Ophiostoma piceae UAMH 11346]
MDRAFGYKKTTYFVAVIQFIGLVIEMMAHHWAQFSVGRIVACAAVGIVENAVPAYNAELAPAATRCLLSGGIMTVTTMDSPRWQILNSRKEEAMTLVDKIRPQKDVMSGATSAEADALERAVVKVRSSQDTGEWMDIFRSNYLRRTWICSTVFVSEQMNDNQFVLSYGATFSVRQGLGAMSSTYNIIAQVVGLGGCVIGVAVTDFTGRRPLLIGVALLEGIHTQRLADSALTLGVDENAGMISPYIRLVSIWKRVARIYTRLESSQLGALAFLLCTYCNAMLDLYRVAMPELFRLRHAFLFPPEKNECLHTLQARSLRLACGMATVLAETAAQGARHLADSKTPLFA